MKKITLLFISTLAVLPLFAQPVLNNDLNFAIGDTYNYDIYTDITNIDPSPGGADLVWDFGTLTGGTYIEGNGGSICVDPSTTPFADSTAVADADICIRNANNPDLSPYQYYECNNTSQNLIALGFHATNNNSYGAYTDRLTALEFPFSYGDSFDDTWDLLIYHIDDGYYYLRDSSIVTVEADAYGTITTPSGEFQNTLRVKRTTTDYSWYDLDGGGLGDPDPYIEIQYDWFAPNIKVPVMIMNDIDWLPGLTVRYLVEHSFTFTTGITDRSDCHLEIFPNPATDRVTIKTDKSFNSVSIYSITGQQLDVTTSQTGQPHQQTIDLSKYPTGIYFIEVGFEDGNAVKEKIIKAN